MKRTVFRNQFVAALSVACFYVLLIFVGMTEFLRPVSLLPALPMAIFASMVPTVLLGIHVLRLESRVAALETELDTQRQIKALTAAKPGSL